MKEEFKNESLLKPLNKNIKQDNFKSNHKSIYELFEGYTESYTCEEFEKYTESDKELW